MFRDAEDQQLAKSDAQDVARFGIEFPLAEAADPVVEQAAVAQHTEQDGLQQAAVRLAEHAAVGVAVDQRFRVVVALGPGMEGRDGGLTDVEVLGRHGAGERWGGERGGGCRLNGWSDRVSPAGPHR